jgi:predicted nucleic acid-binding protein
VIIVSDATPVHYLILIDEIDLLREVYGVIVIPDVVIRELSTDRTPEKVRRWIQSLPAWVQVTQSSPQNQLPFPSLGHGERAAIAIATSSGASILLTDDRSARTAAESTGLQVIPTLAILLAASRFGLVDLPRAVARLRETNFRVSDKVLRSVLRKKVGSRSDSQNDPGQSYT